MIGHIFKIHSDFYYVNTDSGVFECKIREILKKQKTSIFVGDYVELEQLNYDSRQAFISNVVKRKNYIPRPKVANVDQVVIVSAIKEPDLDFEQLDRYLCFCEYYNLSPVLCFNKNDLEDEEEIISQIKSTYEPLGYNIIFTSALEGNGLEVFRKVLNSKTTVLCGSSGVGKSSLINAICSDVKLKTKQVSEKTERGTHTTRHCEIIALIDGAKVVDTPGFSQLKFDFLMPAEVGALFREIGPLEELCKFTDCLHVSEIGCNVIHNIENIAQTRYESYLKFVNEAKEYKKQLTYNGKKIESRAKFLHNKQVTKISSKKRQISRKKNNQNIDKEI